MKRLPDTELEVMKALWDSGPDTPRAALERALAPHGWAANTINTYLTRLADKGFLSARRLAVPLSEPSAAVPCVGRGFPDAPCTVPVRGARRLGAPPPV